MWSAPQRSKGLTHQFVKVLACTISQPRSSGRPRPRTELRLLGEPLWYMAPGNGGVSDGDSSGGGGSSSSSGGGGARVNVWVNAVCDG